MGSNEVETFNHLRGYGPPITTQPSGLSEGAQLIPQGHNPYTGNYAVPFSRAQVSNSYTPNYPTKAMYSSTWSSLGYADDSALDSYGLYPSVCLPPQDPMTSMYGAQESTPTRAWPTVNNRTLSTGVGGMGMFLDQDITNAYSGNGLPYAPLSAIRQPPPAEPAVTSECTSPLSMVSLQNTLPISLIDRHLPVPTASRINGNAMASEVLQTRALPFSPDFKPMALSTDATYTKDAMAWSAGMSTADNRRSPVNSNGPMGPPTSKGSVNPETGVLGYIPETRSPGNSPPSPSVAYSSTAVSTPAPSMNGSYSTMSAELPRLSSSEALMSRHNSSTNLFSFSADSSGKRGSLGDGSSTESTLVNGQRYVPLRQPTAQHPASAGILRRDSFDTRTTLTQHSPIVNLNPNSY